MADAEHEDALHPRRMRIVPAVRAPARIVDVAALHHDLLRLGIDHHARIPVDGGAPVAGEALAAARRREPRHARAPVAVDFAVAHAHAPRLRDEDRIVLSGIAAAALGAVDDVPGQINAAVDRVVFGEEPVAHLVLVDADRDLGARTQRVRARCDDLDRIRRRRGIDHHRTRHRHVALPGAERALRKRLAARRQPRLVA